MRIAITFCLIFTSCECEVISNDEQEKNKTKTKMWLNKVSFLVLFVVCLALSCGQIVQLNEIIDTHVLARINNVVDELRWSRNSDTNKFTRIVGGEDADRNKFSYFGQIISILTDYSGALCGGGLIDVLHILTAAHCIPKSSLLAILVILGSNSTDVDDTGQPIELEQRHFVKYISVHKEYNRRTLANDIAILRFYEKVNLSSTIKPIRLSTRSVMPNTRVEIAGTGKTADNATGISPTLKYVNLRTITNSKCAEIYGNTTITPLLICTESDVNASACSGDSGSPLIDAKTGYQIALLNAGARTCEQGYPNIYTRLPCYFDWIRRRSSANWDGYE